jgi:hypothetical protein
VHFGRKGGADALVGHDDGPDSTAGGVAEIGRRLRVREKLARRVEGGLAQSNATRIVGPNPFFP